MLSSFEKTRGDYSLGNNCGRSEIFRRLFAWYDRRRKHAVLGVE